MNTRNLPRLPGYALFILVIILFSPLPIPAEIHPGADLVAPLEADWVSARGMGLGSSCVAVPGDASLSAVNPALLGTLDSAQLGFHHQGSPESILREGLNASLPIARLGHAGLFFTYLNHGSFTARDTSGEISGDFHSWRMGSKLGFGREIRRNLFVGGATSGAWQTISETHYAMISFDVGIYGNLGKGFGAGASYSHFGPYLRNYLLGSIARLGFSRAIRLDKQFSALACFSYDQEPYETQTLRLGVEGVYRSLLVLRTGIQKPFKSNEQLRLDNLTFGLGLHLGALRMDIAHFPYGDLGSYQRVSLTYDWGFPPKKIIPPPKKPVEKTLLKKPSAPNPALIVFPTLGSNTTRDADIQITPPIPKPSLSTPTPSSLNPPITANPTSTPDDPLKLFFRLPSSNHQEPTESDPIHSDKSVQTLLEMVGKNPQDPQAWMQLGRFYLQKKRPGQAVQCFEQVLRLRPDYQSLREWLNRYYMSLATPTPLTTE